LDIRWRDLSDKLFPKIILGKDHNAEGRKYCSRCDVHSLYEQTLCVCGIAFKPSISKQDKQELRRLRQKRAEQDRIIKFIKKRQTNSKTG